MKVFTQSQDVIDYPWATPRPTVFVYDPHNVFRIFHSIIFVIISDGGTQSNIALMFFSLVMDISEIKMLLWRSNRSSMGQSILILTHWSDWVTHICAWSHIMSDHAFCKIETQILYSIIFTPNAPTSVHNKHKQEQSIKFKKARQKSTQSPTYWEKEWWLLSTSLILFNQELRLISGTQSTRRPIIW